MALNLPHVSNAKSTHQLPLIPYKLFINYFIEKNPQSYHPQYYKK